MQNYYTDILTDIVYFSNWVFSLEMCVFFNKYYLYVYGEAQTFAPLFKSTWFLNYFYKNFLYKISIIGRKFKILEIYIAELWVEYYSRLKTYFKISSTSATSHYYVLALLILCHSCHCSYCWQSTSTTIVIVHQPYCTRTMPSCHFNYNHPKAYF